MSKSKKKAKTQPNRSREAKKAMVLEGRPPSRRFLPFILVAVVVAAVAGTTVMLTGSPTPVVTSSVNAADKASGAVTAAAATTVSFPVDRFADGKARHFAHKADNGITVKYFILKSSDGVIRAAFDACDVCWPAGKGYYQDGDQMVCRNCGRRFDSVLVNEVQGGCNPAPLQRKLEGDQLVIQVRDIVEGGRYFNFKGKV